MGSGSGVVVGVVVVLGVVIFLEEVGGGGVGVVVGVVVSLRFLVDRWIVGVFVGGGGGVFDGGGVFRGSCFFVGGVFVGGGVLVGGVLWGILEVGVERLERLDLVDVGVDVVDRGVRFFLN